jgi:hypothetical protein
MRQVTKGIKRTLLADSHHIIRQVRHVLRQSWSLCYHPNYCILHCVDIGGASSYHSSAFKYHHSHLAIHKPSPRLTITPSYFPCSASPPNQVHEHPCFRERRSGFTGCTCAPYKCTHQDQTCIPGKVIRSSIFLRYSYKFLNKESRSGD